MGVELSVTIVCSLVILVSARFLVFHLTLSSAKEGGFRMKLKQLVKTVLISIVDTFQAIGTNVFVTALLP